MKGFGLFLLVVVVVVGAVFLARPGLLEDIAPGMYAKKHEQAIKQRAKEMLEAVYRKEFDRSLEYVDPLYRRQNDDNKIKFAFGLLHLGVKIGKLTPDDVDVYKVELMNKNKEAQVFVRVNVKGERKEQKPGQWVRADDGLWYACIN